MRSQLESLTTVFALAAVLFLTGCQSTSGPQSVSARPGVAASDSVAAPTPQNRPPLKLPLRDPRIVVKKNQWRLLLFSADKLVRTYRIGLGLSPVGDKVRQGDRRTPEGEFYIFTKNVKSAFYLSLGLSYPNKVHAERGLRDGLITRGQYEAIMRALRGKKGPPQNTPLGGDIYIHGNGAGSDWTWGCVALENEDIRELFDAVSVGTPVTIEP
jgi:murein L,D-transpeptidase YafK